MGKSRIAHRDRILDLARQGHPPREISEMLGLGGKTVSDLLSRERRKGADIPFFKTGPTAGRTRFVILDPPDGLRDALIPHAEARGITVSELAGALLQTAVAHDDLVDAILDDGGEDD
ncbi:hypothetical protein [Sediminimonas sp.]|uniref:hypothetical protein n=1 Tax=Sediminimonas sp. TaxID=2823379 RepID=UPI0025E80A39|nr:hypothetical protein [Sediminimonas sp.]